LISKYDFGEEGSLKENCEFVGGYLRWDGKLWIYNDSLENYGFIMIH